MKIKLEIEQEDFGTLCVCALRYCHGRRTYMPSLVQRIVRANFRNLSARDRAVIADDERFQSDMGLWGDSIDERNWRAFYEALRDFRQKQNEEKQSKEG